MTLLALMLTGAPRIYGFQAYDCNNASAPLEQYSLLEPEPCPDMLKQHELERNLEGEIVQLKKERLIHTTRCQRPFRPSIADSRAGPELLATSRCGKH